MAKVSKNSKINRGGGGKDMVKVVLTAKSPKSGAYFFKEKVVHKDNVKEALNG